MTGCASRHSAGDSRLISNMCWLCLFMVPKILVRSIGIVHELRRGVLVELNSGLASVERTGADQGDGIGSDII